MMKNFTKTLGIRLAEGLAFGVGLMLAEVLGGAIYALTHKEKKK